MTSTSCKTDIRRKSEKPDIRLKTRYQVPIPKDRLLARKTGRLLAPKIRGVPVSKIPGSAGTGRLGGRRFQLRRVLLRDDEFFPKCAEDYTFS